MSQTILETESDQDPRPELTPQIDIKYAFTLKHLLVVLVFGAFFLYFSYIPLFHSDIWGHVAYGHWILDQQALPTSEPFVWLAEGVPITCTAWLGQVLFAAVDKAAGIEAISYLFALSAWLAYVVFARAFYLQTGRVGLAAAGAFLVWTFGWSRHAIVRPEVFGTLCFALLLWMVVGIDPDRTRNAQDAPPRKTMRAWTWVGIPLLFALWANLHGSFVVGFALLGCQALGRVIQVSLERKNLMAGLTDGLAWRWLFLLELSVAATLVNPYGMDLLVHTILFPANPNLDDVLEWFRLEMVSYEGIEAAFSWIVMMVVFRYSRAKVRPTDVLLLIVFTLALCLRVRMVTWYAPVAVVVLMPHLSDMAARMGWGRVEPGDSGLFTTRSFRYSIFSLLIVWISFAFAPVSKLVLGGKPRLPEHIYSQDTPRGLTKFLRENPPVGAVANPQWWGDWLVWDGPKDLRVMITTNAVHVVPRRVWRDYLDLARGEGDVTRILDRYRMNTIIVHKELQVSMTRIVRKLAGWKVVYEDQHALVVAREKVKTDEPEEASAENGL